MYFYVTPHMPAEETDCDMGKSGSEELAGVRRMSWLQTLTLRPGHAACDDAKSMISAGSHEHQRKSLHIHYFYHYEPSTL